MNESQRIEESGDEGANLADILVDDGGDYHVIAGRYWDNSSAERNCKYSYDFSTLDEAIEALDKVSGYPWAYIEYKGRVLELLHKDFKLFEGG